MKRIYIVEGGEKPALVKATTKNGAIRHAAAKLFTAAVASQDQLVEMTAAGVKVEEAGEKELVGAGE